MKVNDRLCGFLVTRVREAEGMQGTLYEMKHEKSGARLAWLKRDESNKTFSITFKTLPSDDTGVFHILEHSVLNGSEKYPVKEPFVELLKGSMQTFLNAMTFPDKTMYPVSSRNEKDFLNLIDVYMDAVLHTTIHTKPETFYQEGWHHELTDAEAPLEYNGVVYNEMKGAYSAVDTQLSAYMERQLYPDTCYRYSSGGDPDCIPDLSYEAFLHQHDVYYHPSNSRIFLDGDMKIEAVLEKIDSFLCEYDDTHFQADIPMQKRCASSVKTYPYAVLEEEDDSCLTQIAMGHVFARYDEKERVIGMQILTDVLCGSSKAPLKQAVVDAGLAEDVEMTVEDGIQQPAVTITVRNCRKEDTDTIRRVIHDTLRDVVENGLDEKLVRGAMNHLEFNLKQRDYGYPKGVLLAIIANESWLYDGDPMLLFSYEKTFGALREHPEQLTELLADVWLDEEHEAVVILEPSKTIEQQKQEALMEKLAAVKASWSEQDMQAVLDMNRRLKELQQREDTPEELAVIPTLQLADVDETMRPRSLKKDTVAGRTVLWNRLETDGIVHAELYFAMPDLTEAELSAIGFATEIFGEAATRNFDSLGLQGEIKTHLGEFSINTETYGCRENLETCTPYLVVGVSFLEEKKEEALRLIEEILLHTKWDDSDLIGNLLRQRKIMEEQMLVASGNEYARRRIQAYVSSEGVSQEYLSGYESIRWTRRTVKQWSSQSQEIIHSLQQLTERVLHRNRLLVSVTGKEDAEWVEKLIHVFEDEACETVEHVKKPWGPRQEGITIPSEVGYAAMGGCLPVETKRKGSLKVLSKILSFYYLWNEIRVQGGAYGTGFNSQMNGFVSFSSYRDPSVAHSLMCYRQAVAYLKALSLNEEELTKSIIGTIASLEPVLSPRLQGKQATVQWLSGYHDEDYQALRSAILATGMDDLRHFAEDLEQLNAYNGICVVAGKRLLAGCDKEQLNILED